MLVAVWSSSSLFVGNKQKEEEVQVREDLNRYKYLLEQKLISSGV